MWIGSKKPSDKRQRYTDTGDQNFGTNSAMWRTGNSSKSAVRRDGSFNRSDHCEEDVMPVIRGRNEQPVLSTERRADLLSQILSELAGESRGTGPTIFEIPIGRGDKFDAVVVWDAWHDVAAGVRNDLVQAAYQTKGQEPALVLGVTFDEAKEQGLLPYRVKLFSGDLKAVPQDKVATVSRRWGGFSQPNDKFEFHFPTEQMAIQVADELQRQFPGTRWMVPSFGMVGAAMTSE